VIGYETPVDGNISMKQFTYRNALVKEVIEADVIINMVVPVAIDLLFGGFNMVTVLTKIQEAFKMSSECLPYIKEAMYKELGKTHVDGLLIA